MSLIGTTVAYGRFAYGMRRYLREPVTADQGREMLRNRLRDRRSNFLRLVKRAVYDNDWSPYLSLLRLAGCEYGDLERMVQSDGIEPALQRLFHAGVYLTVEEFKGKTEVTRGSTSLRFEPEQFNNPFLARSISTSSGGSRSSGTRTTVNLARSRDNALSYAAVFSAHGLTGKPTLMWMEILPSAAGLAALLQLSKLRVTPVRWFSPVHRRAIKPSLSKRVATLYVVYAGRLFGSPMPAPEYVSGEDTQVVADCLNGVLRSGRGCVVFASPSSAARLCHLARLKGYDLSGVTFRVHGEPLTPAKMQEMRSVSAEALNLYAFTEGGVVGHGCAGVKRACDDVHMLTGSVAVIQHRRTTPFGGGEVDALLFSSLLERAPKILLNVESGDYGVLETRECGCELGAIGLTQHLHTIRSFDKLTGEGMTFVGTDMVRIIEEVLPSRFGGSSADYQLLEYEDAQGLTKLGVAISPSVGEVDEQVVTELVLSELARGGDTNRMMAEVWRQGGVLRVRRERPHLTRAGKLLPLHMLNDKRNSG
jgi:hypothetical protein